MRPLRPLALLLVLPLLASCTAADPPEPVRIGAVYPLSGTQGMGGIDEYQGVRVAAELVNADGGIGGRPVVLDQVDVPEADAAPGAIKALADRGVDLVLGSYGSTISSPAAAAAAGRGSLFWETGAVGELAGPGEGDLVFRVAPTGGLLGRGGKLGDLEAGLVVAVAPEQAVGAVAGRGRPDPLQQLGHRAGLAQVGAVAGQAGGRQVHVGVDEPGHQGGVAQVDHPVGAEGGDLGRRDHGGDAAALDGHGKIQAAAKGVAEAVAWVVEARAGRPPDGVGDDREAGHGLGNLLGWSGLAVYVLSPTPGQRWPFGLAPPL